MNAIIVYLFICALTIQAESTFVSNVENISELMNELKNAIEQMYKTLNTFQNRIKAIFSLVRLKEPSIKLRKIFYKQIRMSSLNEAEVDYCLKEINLYKTLLFIANTTKFGMQQCVYDLIFAQKYVNETLSKNLFDTELLANDLLKALDYCSHEFSSLPRELELCAQEILDLSLPRINSTVGHIEYNMKFYENNFTNDFLLSIDCMIGVKSKMQSHYNQLEKFFVACAAKF